MVVTLHSNMAGIGYYGDRIKDALNRDRQAEGRPVVSYETLARLFESKGIVDPKTKTRIGKSRIVSYATDRVTTPQWFLEALAKVLDIPEGWWKTGNNVVDRPQARSAQEGVRLSKIAVPYTQPISPRGLKETYLNRRTDWPRTMRVPAFFESSDNVIAVPVGDSYDSMPHFEPGSTNLVDVSEAGTTLKLDHIYAISLPDGSGEYRRAVWDGEQLVMRAAKKRKPDIVAPSGNDEPAFFVDGMVIANLPDYDEDAPRVRAKFLDTAGSDIPEW